MRAGKVVASGRPTATGRRSTAKPAREPSPRWSSSRFGRIRWPGDAALTSGRFSFDHVQRCPASWPGISQRELLDSFTWPRRSCGAFFLLLTYKVAEAQCEDYAAAGIIINADAALMGLHDFHHDGKS